MFDIESIFKTISLFKPTMQKKDFILIEVNKFQKLNADLQSIFSDKFEFMVEIKKKLAIKSEFC